MALALLRTGRTLTSDQYRVEFAVDSKVARAELADLISRGLVRMVNQRRWARYVLDESSPTPRPAVPSHGEAGLDAGSNANVGVPGDDTRSGAANTGANTQELVLAALAAGPLSRREISERVGVPDRRVLYAIRKLVDAGSVAPTGPARSPHVAYQLIRPQQ
jgi:ATP-dependent DNA helicase RecG